MSYIEIKNIYKIFGPHPKKALKMAQNGENKDNILAKTGHTVGLQNVSLSIEQGETFVVMGLSGSGKSTLIRHLNRLIDPTAGEILFGGENILQMTTARLNAFRRAKLGMVFQRFGLLPHRSVIDNVAYGLEIQRTDKAERLKSARTWIERVGLAGYEDSFPDQLSGGMQQRVGLARALTTDPEVLLMDEAFSALDPLIRSDMQDELMKLQSELHKTIIFITHDLDEALKLGDRIAILKDGALIQVGRPEEIVMNPADDYVRAFTRDVNRSKVLRAKTLMRPTGASDDVTTANTTGWPEIDSNMRLEDILPIAIACPYGISVIDHDHQKIGTLSKDQVIAALAA
ncbi:quaternary amine ABC transporter ATP-binding protein [Thalassospira mesophila]|uniref:Quaternary amine transport ATP-binding protein n=1 Tax=Thalassospira mesophila TaxID=1293891 RepID=A0A1Y2L1X7_9PROT|nr:glycine betaine/L-proline ABC transporter ATP-binding protein [Thalassospira mesophila]OSQ38937.1 glycine/betaine ABC transporter [Thalassospira mesophila]